MASSEGVQSAVQKGGVDRQGRGREREGEARGKQSFKLIVDCCPVVAVKREVRNEWMTDLASRNSIQNALETHRNSATLINSKLASSSLVNSIWQLSNSN